MGKITDKKFFTCSAEELAPKLLGKVICRKKRYGENDFTIKVRIKVTEAYPLGDKDLDANRTKESTTQNLEGGHVHYFFQTASNRCRMDIVAGEKNSAQSVLIAETDLYDGPAETLWALDIDNKNKDDQKYDGLDLLSSDSVWLEDDGTTVIDYYTEKRKNISDDKPLRFVATGFSFKR